MKEFQISPECIFLSFWRNRNLIGALVVREVLGRYRSSFLGILWAFISPIFMLTIYTFVFSGIFNIRWNLQGTSKFEFAFILFIGLIVFNLFSECICRGPLLVTSNINYVKKVVFPLEILPFVALGSALVHAGINLLVWFLAYIMVIGLPYPTSLLAPIIIMPLLFLVLGLMWGLASIGVYIRDMTQLTNMFTISIMFISPIFYPISAIPEKYRYILKLNPIAPMLEDLRDVLFWGVLPNFSYWLIYACICSFVGWVGFVLFQKARRGFADVL